jgi:hypothetical protein
MEILKSGTSGFFSDYVYTATSASLTQFDYGITTNPNLWNATFISSTDRSGTGKMLVQKELLQQIKQYGLKRCLWIIVRLILLNFMFKMQ